ncbi:MSU1 [Candida pseudojiufengensis]|uniref:MSU1 n=1 Tax=Candida pseudojiufengensis TaxID=497109 RepID=UPI0022257487|nr:MSU1 [Candida pseudojiufengensis]KAI5966919.1 MSU1 [Candida pseudojiufengensis]
MLRYEKIPRGVILRNRKLHINCIRHKQKQIETDFQGLRSLIKNNQQPSQLKKSSSKSNVIDRSFLNNLVDKESIRTEKEVDSKTDLSKLSALIKSKKRVFDIEQPDFDLDRPNKQILQEIKKKAEKSNILRYEEPSKEWKKEISKFDELKTFFDQLPGNLKVNGRLVNNPIKVGDLVTMGTDSLRLYIVAGVPKSFNSRIATFLSDKGEIVFASFSNIGYRIPGAIPEKYSSAIERFVKLEHKILNTPPIGIPDAKFSKSNKSLPKEIQPKTKDDEKLNDEMIENAEADYEPSNLIVAQASSQLLTNSNVQTFIIPNSARELYFEALTEISTTAFKMVHEMNQKLEGLHRILQDDVTGEINAPRSISIFEIMNKLRSKSSTAQNLKQGNQSQLGPKPSQMIDYDSQNYPATEYLAILFALKKQSRLWTLQKNKVSYSPTKLIIWPLAQVAHEDEIISDLNGEGSDYFANYCVDIIIRKNKLEKPKNYEHVVKMLKQYVNGKYENDPKVSTVFVSLLRKIDKFLIENGVVVNENQYKSEFSFAKAYDLLTKLNENKIENPNRWSNEAELPGEEISMKADIKRNYYNFVDETFESGNKNNTNSSSIESNFYQRDPLEKIRVDMKNVPIYCIDDPTAHEIDDGISLHEEDDKYVISIHIAEPSSFIKPDSTISSIAFGLSSTAYLPDDVFPMLPQTISKIAGLGVTGQDTRTFVVQYKLNKKSIDDFVIQKAQNPNFQPSKKLLDDINLQIYKNYDVKFALVNKFRQGFTYEAVNKLLNDKDKLKDLIKSNGKSKDSDFDNLYKLEQISSLLWSIRSSNNAYSNNQNNKLLVGEQDSNSNSKTADYEIILPNSNQSIKISSSSSNDESNRSTVLVTENMILANHLTARFAKDKDIKILYRSLDPKFSPELIKEYKELITSNSNSVSQETILNFYSFLSRSLIDDNPNKHFLMGLDMYTNITSPLRRYTDMINQWKFQDYFLGKKQTIPDKSIPGIISYLNAQNDIIRNLQKKSITFYQLLFLKLYNDKFGNLAKNLNLKLKLKTNPKRGSVVSVTIENFTNVNSNVEVSLSLLEDVKKGNLKVGENFDNSRLNLKKIDIIENELIFEYK